MGGANGDPRVLQIERMWTDQRGAAWMRGEEENREKQTESQRKRERHKDREKEREREGEREDLCP